MEDAGGKPRRFGRDEVEALIGAGAMGRVYRALEPARRNGVPVRVHRRVRQHFRRAR